jgi:CrcB protein
MSVGFFMQSYLWVALGGALGSVIRFWASGMVARHFGETFPLGTLVVNVTGSFLIGCFVALTDTEGRWLVSPAFRTFFIFGICGGYTTFSSFSMQTLELVQDREWLYAFLNVLGSVILCLVAVWLGFAAGQIFNRR